MKKWMHDIGRGKNLPENLKCLQNLAVPLYNEYAALELTFSAYVFLQEIVEEKPELAEQEGGAVQFVLALLRGLSGDSPDYMEILSGVKGLRKEITAKMDLFTAYTDRLIIYEYVMNRMELSFEPEKNLDKRLAGIDEEGVVKQLLSWLYADKDQSVMRDKMRFIIGQIPAHLTKTKFAEKISEALTLYKGGERMALDDFVYMIRTSAMLYEPSAYVGAYQEIENVLREFGNADFSGISQERYEELAVMLENGAHFIHEMTDFYYTMQKVVNDIYALCLSMPYWKERSRVFTACQSIWRCLSGREYMDDMLVPLEGRIEPYVEKTSRLEAVFVEVKASYPDEIEKNGMSSFFEDFMTIVNLLSDSLFIDLEKAGGTETADAAYVREQTDELLDELSMHMKGMSRPLKRAVMASVLEKLPMAFQNPEEVEDYIRINLFGCGDKAEKIVVISILTDLMNEDRVG